MFKKAVINLTFWYLALVMSLSIAFSVVHYNTSVRELNLLQSRQDVTLRRGMPMDLSSILQELVNERDQQIKDSKNNIVWRLIYFNIIILIVGGALSYLLARRTLQPIEESVEAQNRFTADASHELRTPLTAIRSELEVALRDKNLSLDESKELHRSVLEEIGKLEKLTNGLLKLAKQDGNNTYNLENCDVNLVMEEALERVDKQAKKNNIVINLKNLEPSEVIKADHWAMVELLSILLDNAIKYSDDGKNIWLTAQLRRHRDLSLNAKEVVIKVRDEGAGIKSSDLPYIFNRFYRADHSRSKNQISGYGLGLAIAKQIVDAHGGHIEVESTPGKGAEFAVYLKV